MAKITASDLAWLAGVIDTIGNVSYRKTKTATLPALAVSSGDTALLERLSELSGTKYTITRRNYSAAGCNEHCKTKHKHVVSVSARWSVTGGRATIIMRAIEPYIQIKGLEISQGIAMGEMVYSKDATAKKMQTLGWAA